MRAFVAIEVGEPVRRQLEALVAGLRSRAGTVRWVGPKQMHLTLAFLGQVSADFVGSVRERLAATAGEHTAFSCRLNGLGAFPGPRRARVVWVGMDEGAEELRVLQAAVVRELVKVGFVPEKRPFSPHLTLGRLKVPADVSRVCETGFSSDRFEVDRVILYQSILKPQGAEHSKLGEWRLGRTET